MKHTSVAIETTQGLIHFPDLTMQAKKAANEASAKPSSALFHDRITLPPMTTKTTRAFVDHSSEWLTTCTVTPVGKFMEAASLLICHSRSTIIDKKTADRTESPISIKKNTQIAELSVATPEQPKFIQPVDTAIFSMTPEGDLHLTNYLTELLRTNKSDQQINTFWFPTQETPGNTKDHAPNQTRTLKKCVKCNKKKNWSRKMTQNCEWNF